MAVLLLFGFSGGGCWWDTRDMRWWWWGVPQPTSTDGAGQTADRTQWERMGKITTVYVEREFSGTSNCAHTLETDRSYTYLCALQKILCFILFYFLVVAVFFLFFWEREREGRAIGKPCLSAPYIVLSMCCAAQPIKLKYIAVKWLRLSTRRRRRRSDRIGWENAIHHII